MPKMPKKPSLSDIIDVYKTTLDYIRSNLSYRSIRPETCCTDEQLIDHINYTLSKEGLAESAEVIHSCKESVKKYKLMQELLIDLPADEHGQPILCIGEIFEEYEEYNAGTNLGFCISCGSNEYCPSPDSKKIKCDECGKNKMYGNKAIIDKFCLNTKFQEWRKNHV